MKADTPSFNPNAAVFTPLELKQKKLETPGNTKVHPTNMVT